jgi:hypothetical protein
MVGVVKVVKFMSNLEFPRVNFPGFREIHRSNDLDRKQDTKLILSANI